jgi:hypothetical protein
MRNIALTVLVVLVTALAGYGSNCPNVTYDNYMASGFSCQVTDLTFSNFNYNASSNPPGFGLPAGSVMVDPIFTPGNAGLAFSAGWYASTGGVGEMDSLLQFTVTSPVSNIFEMSLSMGGVGFSGTGFIGVDETACLGAMLPACTGGTMVTLRVFDSSSGSQLYDSINFTGVDLIDIDKDITVQAGTNGSAEVSLVTDQFGQTPEPGTLSLLGLGTVALVGFARRKLNL